jgi:hypothetical protein
LEKRVDVAEMPHGLARESFPASWNAIGLRQEMPVKIPIDGLLAASINSRRSLGFHFQ